MIPDEVRQNPDFIGNFILYSGAFSLLSSSNYGKMNTQYKNMETSVTNFWEIW